VGDAHHVGRHEALADAFWRHQQAILAQPRADVAVIRGGVAARVHPPTNFDDFAAQGSFGRHAVRARYRSRHAVEQKNSRWRPSLNAIARSGTTKVPQTGSRTIGTPRFGAGVLR